MAWAESLGSWMLDQKINEMTSIASLISSWPLLVTFYFFTIVSVVCLALCTSHVLLHFVKRKKMNKIIFPQELTSSILLHQLCDKLASGNNWQCISPALFRWKSAVSLKRNVLSLFLSGNKIVLLSITKFLVMSISKADISNALTASAVKSHSIPSITSSRHVLKI